MAHNAALPRLAEPLCYSDSIGIAEEPMAMRQAIGMSTRALVIALACASTPSRPVVDQRYSNRYRRSASTTASPRQRSIRNTVSSAVNAGHSQAHASPAASRFRPCCPRPLAGPRPGHPRLRTPRSHSGPAPGAPPRSGTAGRSTGLAATAVLPGGSTRNVPTARPPPLSVEGRTAAAARQAEDWCGSVADSARYAFRRGVGPGPGPAADPSCHPSGSASRGGGL
jgi:hypothetical protein